MRIHHSPCPVMGQRRHRRLCLTSAGLRLGLGPRLLRLRAFGRRRCRLLLRGRARTRPAFTHRPETAAQGSRTEREGGRRGPDAAKAGDRRNTNYTTGTHVLQQRESTPLTLSFFARPRKVDLGLPVLCWRAAASLRSQERRESDKRRRERCRCAAACMRLDDAIAEGQQRTRHARAAASAVSNTPRYLRRR